VTSRSNYAAEPQSTSKNSQPSCEWCDYLGLPLPAAAWSWHRRGTEVLRQTAANSALRDPAPCGSLCAVLLDAGGSSNPSRAWMALVAMAPNWCDEPTFLRSINRRPMQSLRLLTGPPPATPRANRLVAAGGVRLRGCALGRVYDSPGLGPGTPRTEECQCSALRSTQHERRGAGMQIRVVDFFAGCGGMSLGFALAKNEAIEYKVMGGVELDPYAAATFERAMGVPIDVIDVRTLLDPETLDATSKKWDGDGPLLLIGCAPCQGFSSHRKKDDREDPRNGLLAAFAQIAVKLQPEVIVMENVPEMLSRQHWQHFSEWRRILEADGYTVRIAIHNLAEFGVPQERFRALVIASKWENFRMPSAPLSFEDFTTVRQAIGFLPPLEAGGTDSRDPMHQTSKHRPSTIELIRHIPLDGGSRKSLPPELGLDCWQGVDGFRDVYGRLWWDRPAVAITARCRTPSCGRFVHPEQHRGLSVREAALLQGFPKDQVFEGPFDDKFKQIGNAVSPIFAKFVAEHLATEWVADHTDPVRVPATPELKLPLMKSFTSRIAGLKKSRLSVTS
jgi:DNA (cytosine-5)-methyltransferase 1